MLDYIESTTQEEKCAKHHKAESEYIYHARQHKLRYMKNYNNHNDSMECTALVSDLTTGSSWTPIGCNEIFLNNFYICEHQDPYKDIIIKQTSRYGEMKFICSKTSIYAATYCWTLKPPRSTLPQSYSISHYQQVSVIDRFLTSVFLGINVTLYISFTIGKTNTHICLTQQSNYHHMFRGWKVIGCSSENVTHMLVKYPPTKLIQICAKRLYFTCGDGSCLLNTYICDGLIDCSDGSDERDCTFVCKGDVRDAYECEFSYGCNSGQHSTLSQRCDSIAHCDDASDEEHCTFVMHPTHRDREYLNQHLQIKQNGTCKQNMLLCDLSSSGYCYHQHAWCVYEVFHASVLHCPKLEHLQFCEDYECPTMFPCDKSYCIPIFMVCNDITDCPGGKQQNM